MRTLNSKEKVLVTKIIDSRSFYFRTLFSDFFLSNVKLEIDLNQKDVKIYRSPDIDEIRDVFEEIITVIGLVKLLEKHDLLLKVQIEFPIEKVHNFGNFDTDNKPKTTFIFGDDSLKRELANYILAEFFITEELKTFYKNKFRTREEVRHKQILKVSWLAIFVALATSTYAIWQQKTKDQLKYDELSKKVEMFSFRLDSMKLNEAKIEDCDTLKIER